VVTALEPEGSEKSQEAKIFAVKGQQCPVKDFCAVEIARLMEQHRFRQMRCGDWGFSLSQCWRA
jgi:hypothetical protein